MSLAFCQKLGLSYVTCSPYRVPIAPLAAAQGALTQAAATQTPGKHPAAHPAPANRPSGGRASLTVA